MDLKTKDITAMDYAKYRGMSVQMIRRKIKDNKDLVEVISIKRYSRFYTLEVPESLKIPKRKK